MRTSEQTARTAGRGIGLRGVERLREGSRKSNVRVEVMRGCEEEKRGI